MIEQAQMFLRGVNKKQVVAGVAGFLSGVGLTLYFERRGQVVEIILESDDEMAVLQSEDNVLFYESVEDDTTPTVGQVISPVPNDPRMIMVDLQALERREQLIAEHGFTKGMEMYENEYSKGTLIPTEDDEAEDVDEEKSINIFASENTEWDQDAEEASRRSAEGPYVLSKDEFYADEMNYTQTTLTYYEGDNILVDQEDVPVYNYGAAIGPLKFGHGSQDANVFFVRNDRLKAEYEIIRDRGHYRIEVLGLEMEDQSERAQLKHSLRKFRQDD